MRNRLYLIADFNADTFARYLANTAMPDADVKVAPFGQVYQALTGPGPGTDWPALVWTQPETVSDAFRRAAAFEVVDPAQALDEVDAFASAVKRFAQHARSVFVPTWTQPCWERGYGMLEWRPRVGVTHLLARMNLALADALAAEPTIFVLDAARWLAAAGPRAVSLKSWYATKTPFGPAVFETAAADLAAALDGLGGRARRLIILDLDEVLWGGIVGEVGWEGITLGGHDHAGEAFVDFQRALKALTRRGIQLAIASKNDEAVALEVIDRHPEMQLRREDFAAWRINWADKGHNVAALLREVNLGPESAVFIDDSAVERARIMNAIPGVLTPDWPDDPARYRETLAGLRCFDAPHLTIEDRERKGMYTAERVRKETLATAGDLETWLRSLNMTVSVESLTAANLVRATQLLNKTNQLNMTTRRLAQQELQQWVNEPQNLMLTFRVADRFGDSGLTGIVGLTFEQETAKMTDFLLSCRVMGRNVEETMLHAAVTHCRARGVSSLVAELTPTARNAPCLAFLERSGLTRTSAYQFRWDVQLPYGCPPWVNLDDRTGAVSTADR